MSFSNISIFTYLGGVGLRFKGKFLKGKLRELTRKGRLNFFLGGGGVETPILTIFIPLVGLIWINLV